MSSKNAPETPNRSTVGKRTPRPWSLAARLTVWYAGLLAGLLLLFGVTTYLGLRHYLSQTLNESLARQAQQIGESFLVDIARGGAS